MHAAARMRVRRNCVCVATQQSGPPNGWRLLLARSGSEQRTRIHVAVTVWLCILIANIGLFPT
jgi:hypothetical protein